MAELSPTQTVGEFRLGFAGDTFNTAWYLAKIAPDVQVSYLTAVGDDENSARMRDFMRSSAICDDHVQVIPNKTIGIYQIHLKNGERSFSYWRDQSAARELAKDATALARAMATADLIYFSGITLAILDAASRENLFSALRSAREAGSLIAYDTNLRPRLWTNPQIMTQTVTQAAGYADIVLPSFEDEAVWFGDVSPQATIDRYSKGGAARIIVKNGDLPVVFFDNGVIGEVAVEAAADALDTTAAGDSFNAAVLAGILRQNDLEQGIMRGCALAKQVVRKSGALVHLDQDRPITKGDVL